MKRILAQALAVASLVLAMTAGVEPAWGCPGCKEALAAQQEEENPESSGTLWNPAYAYSYSVLFMLSVPAGILITFGTAAYRMTRRPPQPSEECPEDPSRQA